MPIVIKEIHVKSTVLKDKQAPIITQDDISQLKKEVLKDVKEYLHREYLRKNEK